MNVNYKQKKYLKMFFYHLNKIKKKISLLNTFSNEEATQIIAQCT